MHRFYAEESQIRNGTAVLSADDSRHAVRVLRLQRGQEAEIIAGGRRYRAVLADAFENAASFSLLDPLPTTEPALRITLFQGLPKADKMEWIIQKAAEIGISEVVPVRMARCVVRLDEKDAERKTERWRRIAREAGKQSGRCLIPEVSRPLALDEIIPRACSLEACVVPWEEAREPGLRSFFGSRRGLSSLGILIGPEGGIEPQEIGILGGCFQPLTLGPRILRTETAGLVTAAAVLAMCGEME